MPAICNIPLERSIIASAILEEKPLIQLYKSVKPEAFFDLTCQRIALELVKCARKGYTPDVSLIAQKIGSSGFDDIAKILTSTSTAHDISEQCKKLNETATAREIQKKSIEIANKANNVEDCKDFSQWAMGYISSGYQGKTVGELRHISEFFTEVNQDCENLTSGKELGVKTGINEIDNHTGGFQKGEYVLVAGRPGEGKTSLGLSMLLNMARKGKRVGIFSIEMRGAQLVKRLISMESKKIGNIVPFRCYRGTLPFTRKYMEAHKVALQNLKNYPIFVDDYSFTTVSDMEVQLRAFMKKNKLELIVLDYIQIVKSNDSSNKKRNEIVQHISMNFAALIKELQVPAIVLAQATRDTDNSTPTLSSLGESSQLEKDAHIVYCIYQKDKENPEQKSLVNLKGRDTGKSDILLKFCTETTIFEDYPTYEYGEPTPIYNEPNEQGDVF